MSRVGMRRTRPDKIDCSETGCDASHRPEHLIQTRFWQDPFPLEAPVAGNPVHTE